MMSNKHSATKFLVVVISLIFSVHLHAQTDTIRVASDVPPGEGNLNIAVNTAIDEGTLSNSVFMLEANGYYVLTDSIPVPANEHLTIVAPEPGRTQDTAPPQILCSTAYDYPSDKKFNFYCNGDITLKNIWLLYTNTEGEQKFLSLQIAHSPEVVREQVGVFENVIFDYSAIPRNASGAVGISSKHFKGTNRRC